MQVANPILSCMFMLTALGSSLMAQPSCVSSDAPAVIWQITASTGQTGWAGWSYPQIDRFPPHTYANVSTYQAGGYTAGQTIGNWSTTWSYTLSGQPSAASASLQFDGGAFRSTYSVVVNWYSQFMLETAYANNSLIAWVRGGPGTQFRYNANHVGDFTASRLNYGGSLAGGGQTVNFPNATQSSIQLNLTASGVTSTTSSQTRTFIEYPGITYSRAQFTYGLGDNMSVMATAFQSCIMLCPGSSVNGSGGVDSGLTIELPIGVPPVATHITANPSIASNGNVAYVPPMTVINLRAHALDPDDPPSPSNGIVCYRWYADGQYLLTSCTPDGPGIINPGQSINVVVEAVDNEGMVDSATLTLVAAPVWQVSGPGHNGGGGGLVPTLAGSGSLPSGYFHVGLQNAPANSPAFFVVGSQMANTPLLGGILNPSPEAVVPFTTAPTGSQSLISSGTVSATGPLFLQVWIIDSLGFAVSSNGIVAF